MCGRYYIDIDIEGIRDIHEEVNRRYPGVELGKGEVFPTQEVPIITPDGPSLAKWGFPSYEKSRSLINARAETAPQKPTFKQSFREQRCVVPTTGFFEWTKDKPKTKYLFKLKDVDILYLAGLCRYFGDELHMVILTRGANESISDVHSRMPVILIEDQLDIWLHDIDEALAILEGDSPQLERRLDNRSDQCQGYIEQLKIDIVNNQGKCHP